MSGDESVIADTLKSARDVCRFGVSQRENKTARAPTKRIGERKGLEGCRWCCARKTSLGGVPLDRIVKFSGRWLAKRRCSEMCRRGGELLQAFI